VETLLSDGIRKSENCWIKFIKKGKVVPVHAMKAYKGSRGIAPHILYLSTKWS
jgi:hypothetical protein